MNAEETGKQGNIRNRNWLGHGIAMELLHGNMFTLKEKLKVTHELYSCTFINNLSTTSLYVIKVKKF